MDGESPEGLTPVSREVAVSSTATLDLQFTDIAPQKQSIVISAKTVDPVLDLRNSEVFERTLFTRDDQALQQLKAGGADALEELRVLPQRVVFHRSFNDRVSID